METKKFNKGIFFSGLLILIFSIVGLFLLSLPYLSVVETYPNSQASSTFYTGYDLIFQNINLNAEAEATMHLVGFIFFLVGSFIFVLIEIINFVSKDKSKKITLSLSGLSTKKSALKALEIISNILLAIIAAMIIAFGFLSVKSGTSYISYNICLAKSIGAILLGLNFLILAYNLDLVFHYAISNLPKEESKQVKTTKEAQ